MVMAMETLRYVVLNRLLEIETNGSDFMLPVFGVIIVWILVDRIGG